MKKIIFLIIALLTLLTSDVFAKKLVFNPTEGIEGVVAFGDTFDILKMKEEFGEITRTEDRGVNSDGACIKLYDFSSGFGCLTGNDKILQMWLSGDTIKMNSGIKIGSDFDDIKDKYGLFFATDGDPKYGTGMLIYNLQPDHVLNFGISIEGKCISIMSSHCALIYKITPSSAILKFWSAPFDLEIPENNGEIPKAKVINEMSVLDGNYMIITGEVINNTAMEIRYVEITADLYNSSGQIIDTIHSYIEGIHLKPGITGEFTLISKKGSLADRYELKVNYE